MSSSAVGAAATPSRAVGGDVDEVELARELPRDRLNDPESMEFARERLNEPGATCTPVSERFFGRLRKRRRFALATASARRNS